MKAKLLILFFFCLNLTFAQDTTWVQTFTFDSITTRRANFEFPSELNNKRFEKPVEEDEIEVGSCTNGK